MNTDSEFYIDINGEEISLGGAREESPTGDLEFFYKGKPIKSLAINSDGTISTYAETYSRMSKDLKLYKKYIKDLQKNTVYKNIFEGKCPFHKDNHPSFRINLEGKTWQCSSCGKRGMSIKSFLNELDYVNSLPSIEKQLKAIPLAFNLKEVEEILISIQEKLDDGCW
jgi:hypothetical protein